MVEIQDRWVIWVSEDKTGLWENLDLMVKVDLQVLQEDQDIQDPWVEEDSQDFQVIQD